MLCECLTDPWRLADRRSIAEPKLDGQRVQLHVQHSFALCCYWYTCFTSHPCPMTVRSALNHESLNTTHSPERIRVVVEHPASASARIANNMNFILLPPHALSASHSTDAPASVEHRCFAEQRGCQEQHDGRSLLFRRSPGTIQGSVCSFAPSSRRKGANERGSQGFSGRRRSSGNIECSLCCEARCQL